VRGLRGPVRRQLPPSPAYGTETWDYAVRDGAFLHGRGRVIVFRVQPVRGLGFRKGDIVSQTTWRFVR